MKNTIIFIALSLFATVVHSDTTADALKLAKRWQKGNVVKPIMGDNGRVLFAFGMTQPSVVCAPLKLCDIALEPGEIINDVKVGDDTRWVIDGAIVGNNEARREHILIKPKAAGLEHTLFIATDRRAYSINLISHAKDNMGKIGFTYGAKSSPVGNEISNNRVYQGTAAPVAPAVAVNVDVVSDRDILGSNLNFDYRIWGDKVKWKPVRVYDDGIKTFIDFDINKIQGRELPALMIYDTNSLGSIINYRAQRGRYIVDGLFDHAGLVLGVGRKQSKVNINRVKGHAAIDQPYRN